MHDRRTERPETFTTFILNCDTLLSCNIDFVSGSYAMTFKQQTYPAAFSSEEVPSSLADRNPARGSCCTIRISSPEALIVAGGVLTVPPARALGPSTPPASASGRVFTTRCICSSSAVVAALGLLFFI